MSTESQEQREERVLRHLVQARERMEQDVATTHDTMLRRIEVDAATVVTLSMVTELLPERIQEQVQAILSLHDKVWHADLPPEHGATPRKPLREHRWGRLPFFPRSPDNNDLRLWRISTWLPFLS